MGWIFLLVLSPAMWRKFSHCPDLSSENGRGRKLAGAAVSLTNPPKMNLWTWGALGYKIGTLCSQLLPFSVLTTSVPPQNFNHFQSHHSKWPLWPLDWLSGPEINVLVFRLLYLENRALVFPPLGTILIQARFVVVFLAVFTNSSRLSVRERCFLQVFHSAFMAQIMEIPLGYAGARLCASHSYVCLIKCIYFLTTKPSCFQQHQRWNTIVLVISYAPCLCSCFAVLL